MTGKEILTLRFYADNKVMLGEFDNTPLIISTDKDVLAEEIVELISTMSVGDIFSVSLVDEARLEYEKDAAAMEQSFDFDD